MKFALHYPGELTDPDHVNRNITKEETDDLIEQVAEYIPAVADAGLIAAKTCLYANSADENFIIDHLPGYDGDVTIACSVEAKVKKPGASTVPVKKLFGIVRELNNPEIDLEVDEKNTCSIRSGESFYKINGLSADEFPPIQKFKENKKIALPQDKLKNMLRKTSFAISTAR